MPFLHPGLFWLFVPLAAIPILLHLLTLHRLKTVELSTFRFLFDSYVQQRRRMQFLEALLAMLRTLFLLFLIVMVCRPIVEKSSKLLPTGSSGGRDVLLLVDCSASMGAHSGGKTALERAQAAALAIAAKLGREDRITLVRLTSRAEEVISRFSTDAQAVRDHIEGLKTTSARGNVYAAFANLFGAESTRRANPVVYLFTDCQATGWREARDQGLEKLLPAKTPFYVVNVAPGQEQSNCSVLGDAPKQTRAIAGLPFALQPRIVNWSKKQTAELTLGVFIDEKEIFRTRLTLQPEETATPRLPPYTPHLPADAPPHPVVQRARFEVTSRTPDPFPDDDVFRFTIHVVPRVKVRVINGNPAAEPFDDEAFYLHRGLTARDTRRGEGEKPGPAEASRELQQRLDVQEVAETALTAETLRDVSVVMLANCGRLSTGQMEWLREYVAQGGGLVIFPGDKVTPDFYNQQFFPAAQGEQLTAARLGPPEGDLENEKTFAQIDELDLSHPALTVFNNPDPKEKHFKTVRVYKRFKLTLPEKGGSAWPMARLSTGAPALVESRFGDGRVILAAFPAHMRWTNLPARADFVPLVLRLATHVARAPEVETPSAVPADGVANLSVTRAWEPVEASVRGPAGLTTTQQLERSGPRLVGAFEQTAERGYYSFDVKSIRVDQPRIESLTFAVNLSKDESDPAVLSEKQLRGLLPSVDFHYVDAAADAEPVKQSLGGHQEIWRPLWFILLFVIIVLEFLMATTRGRGRKEDEQPLAAQGS